jgi:WD40 repeat protein
MAFSPDGNVLAAVPLGAGDSYPNLVIWDVDTLQPVQTLVGHTESIYSFAWANNDRLATVSFDHTIRLWDVPTGQTTRIINVDLIRRLEWYPDDENLYVIDIEDNKTVINVSTGDSIEFELPPPVITVTPSPTANQTVQPPS